MLNPLSTATGGQLGYTKPAFLAWAYPLLQAFVHCPGSQLLTPVNVYNYGLWALLLMTTFSLHLLDVHTYPSPQLGNRWDVLPVQWRGDLQPHHLLLQDA
jgi:hypothetical protein